MASATATASNTARAAATASPISQKMERGNQCMRFLGVWEPGAGAWWAECSDGGISQYWQGVGHYRNAAQKSIVAAGWRPRFGRILSHRVSTTGGKG
ncbi:hypothetical protein SDC9_112830 [bioreactor metagenome]|uniref:Uncharacterized protein n=1 Tax=bioreactor metagenome TaxID=1076179 RepID=A0A645BKZ2_9ZZZZ